MAVGLCVGGAALQHRSLPAYRGAGLGDSRWRQTDTHAGAGAGARMHAIAQREGGRERERERERELFSIRGGSCTPFNATSSACLISIVP